MRMSETVGNLSAALTGFLGEVENPKNTADNPFYKSKYAPLADILNGVRGLLAKHGLAIIQEASANGEYATVGTTLLCGNEWLQTDPLTLKVDKLTPQGAGSAITYARRYQLSALLGIASEADDDGNHASELDTTRSTPRLAASPKTTTAPETTLTNSQRNTIFAIARGHKLSDEELKEIVYNKFDVDSITKLTKKQASEVIDYLKSTEAMENVQ